MLQQTFLHLPGVGEYRERMFWRAGLRNWNAFLEACSCGVVKGRQAERLTPAAIWKKPWRSSSHRGPSAGRHL